MTSMQGHEASKGLNGNGLEARCTSDALMCLGEIEAYVGVDEDTLRALVEWFGFPAIELPGGWVSSEKAIDHWLVTRRITGRMMWSD